MPVFEADDMPDDDALLGRVNEFLGQANLFDSSDDTPATPDTSDTLETSDTSETPVDDSVDDTVDSVQDVDSVDSVQDVDSVADLGDSPESSDAPSAGSRDDGAGGTAGEGGEGRPSSPELVDLIPLSDGTVVRRDDLEAVYRWVASLTPEQLSAFNTVQASDVPAEPAKPEAPKLDLSESLDPALAEYVQTQFEQLRAEQERFAAFIASQQQAAQAQWEREVEVALQKARDVIREEFGLDDQQLTELENITARMQIVPALQPSVSDPVELFAKSMRVAARSDEKFRSMIVESEVERRVAERLARADQVAEKKAKAAAVSGRSSVSREVTVPMTAEERERAFLEDVRRMMNGSDSA